MPRNNRSSDPQKVVHEKVNNGLGFTLPEGDFDNLLNETGMKRDLIDPLPQDLDGYADELVDHWRKSQAKSGLTRHEIRQTPEGWLAERELIVSRVIAADLAEDPTVVAQRAALGLSDEQVEIGGLDRWLHARVWEETPPNWPYPCYWCNQKPKAHQERDGIPIYGRGRRPRGARTVQWFPNTPEGWRRAERWTKAQQGEWRVNWYDPRPFSLFELHPKAKGAQKKPDRLLLPYMSLDEHGAWVERRPWVLANRSSRLSALASAATELGRNHQLDDAAIVTFILTNEPPLYSAARGIIEVDGVDKVVLDQGAPGLRHYGSRITLSLDPAFMPEEVATLYRSMLNEYFPRWDERGRSHVRSMRAAAEVVAAGGVADKASMQVFNERYPSMRWQNKKRTTKAKIETEGVLSNYQKQVQLVLRQLDPLKGWDVRPRHQRRARPPISPRSTPEDSRTRDFRNISTDQLAVFYGLVPEGRRSVQPGGVITVADWALESYECQPTIWEAVPRPG